MRDVRLIGAVANGRVAGRSGAGMLWRAPADLERFRQITTGSTVVMGRATFHDIGRPLPHRKNIVLTDDDLVSQAEGCGVEWAGSLDEALSRQGRHDPIFVIGGARPWNEALALASTIYLTRLDISVRGDVLFPAIDSQAWRVQESQKVVTPVNGTPARCEFAVFRRHGLGDL